VSQDGAAEDIAHAAAEATAAAEANEPPAKCRWNGGQLEVRVWGAQQETREAVSVADIERTRGAAATAGVSTGAETFTAYVMQVRWTHGESEGEGGNMVGSGSGNGSDSSGAAADEGAIISKAFMVSRRYREFEQVRVDLAIAL